MKSLSTIGLGFFLSFFLGCEKAMDPHTNVPIIDEIDSISYSVGLLAAQSAKAQGFEEIDLRVLEKAVNDVFCDSTLLVDFAHAKYLLQSYAQKRFMAQQEERKRQETLFLERNKTKKGVISLPSGLQYKVITQGTGEKPSYFDQVAAHLHGETQDGAVIQSSLDEDPPTFRVRGTPPGLQEALQLMPVGSKWQLFVPSHLGYGSRGSVSAGVEPNTLLIFEVELLSIY